MNRTTAIIATVVTSLLCGLPGIIACCLGTLFAVMVNDPDLEVRKNRQALLMAVRDVVLEVADFAAFQIS